MLITGGRTVTGFRTSLVAHQLSMPVKSIAVEDKLNITSRIGSLPKRRVKKKGEKVPKKKEKKNSPVLPIMYVRKTQLNDSMESLSS